MQTLSLAQAGASAASSSAAAAGGRHGPLYPRTPIEGYGFRPHSGASTPTGTGSSLGFTQAASETVAQDEDKRLNDEVRAALTAPPQLSVGREAQLPEGGIADAEGLGWPG